MNTTETTQVPVRLDIDAHAAGFIRALGHLDNAAVKEADRAEIDHRLRELIRLRVSQLNGCAYCVDMQTKDARAVGETDERLAALPVWEETGFFSPAERSAIAFAEAMVRMSRDHVPAARFAAVAQHYDADEIAAIVSLVVAVSAWNGVGVSLRPWQPGSYTVS